MKSHFLVTLLILIFVGFVHNQLEMPTSHGFNNKDPRYYIKVKRLICNNNPALVTLTHCLMKLQRNTNGAFSIGLIFGATESKMNVKVATLTRNSANIYQGSAVQQTMDFCSFMVHKDRPSLVTMLVPSFCENPMLPDCPYKGNMVMNFTVPKLNIDPMFAMTGDHKLVLNWTRPAGLFLFSHEFDVYVKGVQSSLI